jgi:septal ring factor EnvC (AmiA/AmiB activator)
MNGQDLELQFPRPVKLATQVAEINEHLVEIIEHLGGQTDGNDNCKEDIAEIQRLLKEIQAALTTLNGRIDGLESRIAALENGDIPVEISRKLNLVDFALLNLNEENLLTLEKLYDLAFGESEPGILYQKLPPDSTLKLRETLNNCRKDQNLPVRTG